ncbi:MAG TPA: hypothetical protein VMZ27_16080 [Candidatus Saccharimonadales bacterium]|nr:hypothetical protein [Candidatus Saccharimonadales bacterium]
MIITNRQKLLSILAITVIAIWVGDKMILTPLTKLYRTRETRIAELNKSISQGNVLLGRSQSIHSRWDQMRTNTLPSETSVAENEVLRAFERWSQDSKISITSIRPQWKRTAEDYMTMECRADASGNIQALTRFLYDVEQDPMAFKVEIVEITTHDNDGQQLSLALQVSGLLLNPQEP